MDNIIKLATSQPTRPIHGCGTCRFYRSTMSYCHATGVPTHWARSEWGECQDGRLWEAKPPSFLKRLGSTIIKKFGA